jgi:hypothetical protein
MIATKFTIELDIGLSVLLQAALPQLVTDRETKLIVVGGPSDRTAIADAALRSRKRNAERAPSLGPVRRALPTTVVSRKTRPLNARRRSANRDTSERRQNIRSVDPRRISPVTISVRMEAASQSVAVVQSGRA